MSLKPQRLSIDFIRSCSKLVLVQNISQHDSMSSRTLLRTKQSFSILKSCCCDRSDRLLKMSLSPKLCHHSANHPAATDQSQNQVDRSISLHLLRSLNPITLRPWFNPSSPNLRCCSISVIRYDRTALAKTLL